MSIAIADYPAFVIAIVLFLALPGPGNLAIIASTAQARIRGGLAATLGIIAGDQILMWCAVAGVAALLKATPTAFAAVQWVGAAYLAWLGARMLLAKGAQGAAVIRIRPGHLFRQAFLITLLNPKAIIFYMAFFPLFIDPATHRGASTFVAMALTIALITALYCLLLCVFAQAVSRQLRAHTRVAMALQRVAGLFLVGFGLRLVRD